MIRISIANNPECRESGHTLQILKKYEQNVYLTVCTRCGILFGVNHNIGLVLPVGIQIGENNAEGLD